MGGEVTFAGDMVVYFPQVMVVAATVTTQNSSAHYLSLSCLSSLFTLSLVVPALYSTPFVDTTYK